MSALYHAIYDFLFDPFTWAEQPTEIDQRCVDIQFGEDTQQLRRPQ
jgi:hypothetical protein